MRAIALPVEQLQSDFAFLLSRVSATNVPDFERGTGFLFRKGDVLGGDSADLAVKLASLRRAAPVGYALHLIELEAGEVTEDEAGTRLAEIVAGPGLERRPPVESRVNLVARQRGLLKIDLPRLELLNEVPGVAVFTLYDGTAVNAGTEVAGAKVTPLVYPLAGLDEVAAVVGSQPVVDVLPFQPLRVGVVVRERLSSQAVSRFMTAVEHKLAWFGAELLGVRVVGNVASAIETSLLDFKGRRADLILHVGGHSSDPLDPIFEVLPALKVGMMRHGAPAHPGTLFWLAYWGETALFGLASCGMFSRTTVGDLLLARLMAGERLGSKDVARLGHGGLFTREMAFRFPPYGLQTEAED